MGSGVLEPATGYGFPGGMLATTVLLAGESQAPPARLERATY